MKIFAKVRRPVLSLALGFTASLALSSCDRTSPKGAEGNAGPEVSSAQFFTVPEDQRSHLQIVTVQPTTLARTLRLTGAVAYNSFRTTPVISQVSGPVSRVVVVPGQKVSHGQPMLYVASPDYSQLRSNYLKARDANGLAQKSFTRAQDLYQHHAISEQNLEQAQSASVQAGSDLISAEASLKVMGISDPESLLKAPPSFEVPVKAPIAGEVVEQLVSAGQLLAPGNTQCFTISDTGTVWVLVNVYQKDLPYVRVGDQVTITTDAYPDVFKGKISYVAASVDASTRTLQARIETANPAKKLKKDMFVAASVSAGKIENAMAVPDSAVLRDSENQPFVYAEVSPNQYGRRGITAGESINGQTQITSGIKPGDRVVGDGSLFLQFANSLQK